ncbi:MAG: GxxExxY protein [Pyrinomonadaceae bacterium]|nr:GxxExxY protein [Pyrinomonadaceae bacterium]
MTAISKKYLDRLSYQVVGAAIEVHKAIGPGLLESVYHECLKREFSLRDIGFQSELTVPVQFKGISVTTDLRCDFLVENILVVELKTVAAFAPIHQAQLLTYMKLLNAPKGLLLNFHCVNLFKDGPKTLVNEIYRSLPEE